MKDFNNACTFTDRESDAARIYLREIMHFPLLTAEEERELVKQRDEGDERAAERLVQSNLRFVVSVAKQYHGKTLSLMDLIEEGNIGLMRAARLFKADKEVRFITFARHLINEDIKKALGEKDRMIGSLVKGVRHESEVRRFVGRYEQLYEHLPSAQEVVEATGLPREEVVTILYSTDSVKDLDTHDRTGGDEPQRFIDHEDDCQRVASFLSLLSPTERRVIEHQYGLNGRRELSLQETALEMDISYSRARKLSSAAMKRMRESEDLSI